MGKTKITQTKLREILSREMNLQKPEFHLRSHGAKISGSIVSDTFVGKDDAARQQEIWDVLEREYGGESVRCVGVLLAYTRDEWNVTLN